MRHRVRIRPTLLLPTLLLLATVVTTHAQSRCPGGAVALNPSLDLQRIINAQPSGTTYCLADGVYAGGLTPKDNDQYIAQSIGGAVFDGGYTRAHAFISTFDRQTDANITGVTIDGLVIRRYRTDTPWNYGAVDANRGWRLLNLLVEDNTSGVIYGRGNWVCSDGALVQNSTFRNNTHAALYWNGVDADFIGNTLVNNGWGAAASDRYWYGSVKLTNQGIWGQSSICPTQSGAQVYVAHNRSIYNAAAGWWHDINVQNYVFELNTLQFNERWGFFHEISGGGIARNNVLECNGARFSFDDTSAWGSANIFIVSSQNSTIEQNTVRICGAGRSASIGGATYSTTRPGAGITLLAEGRQPLTNNTVRNNTIIQMDSAVNWYSYITQYNNSPMSGNSFVGNTYYVLTGGQARWNWMDNARNFSTWQGTHGQDVAGVQSTAAPPTGAAPTPTLQPTLPVGSGTPTLAPTATHTPLPSATPPPTSGVYDGVVAAIPGRIQAENFDWGANTTAYNDTSPGQEGGALYRAGDVDLKLSPYGGVAVGWFIDGEWLAYTVNVATTGYYDISIFGGAVESGRQIRLEFGGVNRTGSITMPQTADWQTYATVTVRNIYLTAGQQSMRLYNERGYLDVDWLELVFVNGVTSTPTPTLTPSITPTPSATPTLVSGTSTPTPTPAPTFTPSPTSAAPSVLATRQAEYFGLQTQVAVAAATQGALQATQVGVDEQIAQQQAHILELSRLLAAAWQAIRSWYGG
jgi:hypothetical protein